MDRHNMMILIGINRCLRKDICTHICKSMGKCGYRQTGKDIESVYYEKHKNEDSLYDL